MPDRKVVMLDANVIVTNASHPDNWEVKHWFDQNRAKRIKLVTLSTVADVIAYRSNPLTRDNAMKRFTSMGGEVVFPDRLPFSYFHNYAKDPLIRSCVLGRTHGLTEELYDPEDMAQYHAASVVSTREALGGIPISCIVTGDNRFLEMVELTAQGSYVLCIMNDPKQVPAGRLVASDFPAVISVWSNVCED